MKVYIVTYDYHDDKRVAEVFTNEGAAEDFVKYGDFNYKVTEWEVQNN